MRPPLAATLAALLAACAGERAATPTYEALPPQPQAQAAPPAEPASPPTAPGRTGYDAVRAANGEPLIEPDDASMRGVVWQVPEADCYGQYHLRLSPRRVTSILFPPGETYTGAQSSDVENYPIEVADSGDRVAVTLSIQAPQPRAYLHVHTSGCTYRFVMDSVRPSAALDTLELNHSDPRPAAVAQAPTPRGAFTKLTLVPASGTPPAWMPTEAWADSLKLVVCMPTPPTLPTLAAGRDGEQVVAYHVTNRGDKTCMHTDRRVTEGLLRLGDPAQGGEAVRFTAGEG